MTTWILSNLDRKIIFAFCHQVLLEQQLELLELVSFAFCKDLSTSLPLSFATMPMNMKWLIVVNLIGFVLKNTLIYIILARENILPEFWAICNSELFFHLQKKAGNGGNQEKTEQVESLRLLVSEANFTQVSIKAFTFLSGYSFILYIIYVFNHIMPFSCYDR